MPMATKPKFINILVMEYINLYSVPLNATLRKLVNTEHTTGNSGSKICLT